MMWQLIFSTIFAENAQILCSRASEKVDVSSFLLLFHIVFINDVFDLVVDLEDVKNF